MKVAVIYDLTEAGGVQTCVFSLVKGLNNQGIIPSLFWDEAPNAELLVQSGIKVEFIKLKFCFSSSLIKRLPNVFRYILWPFNLVRFSKIPQEFDFIYSFSMNVLIDQDRKHLLYLSGPPIVPQLDSKAIKFRLAQKIYKLFIRPFYPAYEHQPKANYVINSQYTAQLFEAAHNRKIEVIYPSNQLKFENLNENDLQNRDTVTFFSRIVNYKRPEFLIKLAMIYPDTNFAILGAVSRNRMEYLNYLKKYAQERNLKNLTFYPNATTEVIEDVLKRTRFYIFPAINEHFGITTVEAIIKGCVPFVHDSGGQREIVPIESLRFMDDDFLAKFHKLSQYSEIELSEIRKSIHTKAYAFTEDFFIKSMLEYLNG